MYTKAIGVVDVSCISWVTNWTKDDLHWSDLFLNFHGSIAACFHAVFFTCLPWTINRECSTCDNFVNCRNIFIWCRMPVTLNHAPDTQTNMNIKTGVTLSAAPPALGRSSASHYARLQPASRAPDSILTTFLVSEIVCSASLGFYVFLF